MPAVKDVGELNDYAPAVLTARGSTSPTDLCGRCLRLTIGVHLDPEQPSGGSPERRSRFQLLIVVRLAGSIALIVLGLHQLRVFGGGGGGSNGVTAPPVNVGPSSNGDGGSGSRIAVGQGAVWVTNADTNTVSRIDPSTGKIIGSAIPVGNDPVAIAVSQGAVWVANQNSNSFSRIDPYRVPSQGTHRY
jgi:hypothetical protein